jgi:hypothetical protein
LQLRQLRAVLKAKANGSGSATYGAAHFGLEIASLTIEKTAAAFGGRRLWSLTYQGSRNNTVNNQTPGSIAWRRPFPADFITVGSA